MAGAGRPAAERAGDAGPAGGGRDRVAPAGGRSLARPGGGLAAVAAVRPAHHLLRGGRQASLHPLSIMALRAAAAAKS